MRNEVYLCGDTLYFILIEYPLFGIDLIFGSENLLFLYCKDLFYKS